MTLHFAFATKAAALILQLLPLYMYVNLNSLVHFEQQSFSPLLAAVQTSGAVHVFPQAPRRHAAEDPRLLRAPISGEDV